MKISVVIPCYNAERFIGEAIESALGQTHPDVEVVVVDDGSTDGSLEVIRSFGDAVRWETGPNRGGCAARNRGVELARGELIQFLDADDLLHPRKLQRQATEMERSGADVVFCHGQSRPVDHPQYRRRYDGGDPVVFILGGVLPTPAPLHYRHNLERVGGFREGLPYAQERDLHLRLACRGLRFHALPEVLYTVRHVEGSVSSDRLRGLSQRASTFWPCYRGLEERGELTDARASAFAGSLASSARDYLRLGLPDRADDYFRQARQMHPDGGLKGAYRGPARLMRHVFGAMFTERAGQLKQRLIHGRRLKSGVVRYPRGAADGVGDVGGVGELEAERL